MSASAAKDWKSAALLLEAGADPSVATPGYPDTSPLRWAYANDNKIAVAIRESDGEPFVLPIELEKAMGKLVGGCQRSYLAGGSCGRDHRAAADGSEARQGPSRQVVPPAN